MSAKAAEDVDTEVVETEPAPPRTITAADRLAKAAAIAQRVAEDARDRLELALPKEQHEHQATLAHVDVLLEQRGALRADVEALWFTLGSVLTLFDPHEHRTPKQQQALRAARDLHALWTIDKPAEVEDGSSIEPVSDATASG